MKLDGNDNGTLANDVFSYQDEHVTGITASC